MEGGDSLGEKILITEVAPRDGLQILPRFVPTEVKTALIASLAEAGCEEIEAASFVSKKWVPQFSDAGEICRHFAGLYPNTIFTFLVPNLKGAQLAIDAGARQIFVTTSASVKHCRDNLNQSIDEVLEGAERIAELCNKHGVVYTASIAAAFGYSSDRDGVPEERVLSMISRFEKAGFGSVTLCDTAGEANPEKTFELCSSAIKCSGIPIGVHFHQNGGIEFANALAALKDGIRIFESAAGGLGGCPYVKKAKGNIATEKLVEMFRAMGYEIGIDPVLISECAEKAKKIRDEYGVPCELSDQTHSN